MFSSVSVPWPRRVLKARCSFSVRFSNIGQIQVYRRSVVSGQWSTPRVGVGQLGSGAGAPVSELGRLRCLSRVQAASEMMGPQYCGLGIVERIVVGTGGQDEEFGAAGAAGDEIVRHLQREETVLIAMNNENWQGATAESVLCGPDGRDNEGKKSGNPCGARSFAERGIAGAKHEAIGVTRLRMAGATPVPSENPRSEIGTVGCETAEQCEGRRSHPARIGSKSMKPVLRP